MPAKRAGGPLLVRWQLERTMYDFKNSFSPAFVYIHRTKYIFSRNMFCLPHFWAKIHSENRTIKNIVVVQPKRNIGLEPIITCYWGSFWDLEIFLPLYQSKKKIWIHCFYKNFRQFLLRGDALAGSLCVDVWGMHPHT